MDEALNQYLKSDIEKRLILIDEWGQKKECKLIPCLIYALGDSDWRARKSATSALGQFEKDDKLIEGLVEALKNKENAGCRNAAVEILIQLGKFSVYPLMSVFREMDHNVKKFIIDILGEIGDRRSTQFLIKVLKEKNENVRLAGVEALGKLKDVQVVPYFLKLLDDKSSLFNFTIIKSLEMIGDPRAIDMLISLMNRKGLERITIETLGSFGDLRSLNPILSVLQVERKFIRNSAIRSLLDLSSGMTMHKEILIRERLREIYSQGLGLYLMSALDDPDPKVKCGAIRIFGWVCDTNAVKKLIPMLGADFRDEVSETLIQMGREAVHILIPEILNHPEKIREGIGWVLGEIGDRRAVFALINLLDDPCGHVRQVSAHALGKLRDLQGVKPLLKTLGDTYHNVQETAAEALSLIGGRSLVDQLKKMVNHDLATMRLHAIQLLGILDPENSMEELEIGLKDENPRVRNAAVISLGKIFSREASLGIIGALADEDSQVRLSALSILVKIKDSDWLKHVESLVHDNDIWVRAAVARSLVFSEGKGKSYLLDLLNDPIGVVQIAALEALGNLREPSIVPIILSMTRASDPDVKVAAIDSLGHIGDPIVKDSLREFLNDSHWNVRAAAAMSLGRLQDISIRDSLIHLAHHDGDPLVRKSALFALDQLQEV